MPQKRVVERIGGEGPCQTHRGAPTFTVIVPTFRRPDKLALCLQSLAEQTLPKSAFEVIVVDDAVAESMTGAIVESIPDLSCHLLGQNRLGAAAARNRGAFEARGRYLAFTDDDCRPAPDWLETLEQRMAEQDDTVMVGGRVINALRDDPFASASQALVDFMSDYFNGNHQMAQMITSNNFCVPVKAFRKVGGFDPAFYGAGGEDREIYMRWRHAGHRLIHAPEVVVYHAHDMTLREFIRQHLAYGQGAAILRRCIAEYGYTVIPPGAKKSFYWSLLRYPWRAPEMGSPWEETALFTLSQVANVAGYFYARLRERTGWLPPITP